jgi:hypothetical protein
LDNFRATEDDVDAATPVDAQNAPTGVWKSRREREIPTAPTSIIFCLKEEEKKKKRRTKSKSAHTNCSLVGSSMLSITSVRRMNNHLFAGNILK